MEDKKVKLGLCPYCNSEEYEANLSEFVRDYEIPYIVIGCDCQKCNKTFTEYYQIDEVKLDDISFKDSKIYNNSIGTGHKQILLKAINLLIETEGDTNDYTDLITILKGGLVRGD